MHTWRPGDWHGRGKGGKKEAEEGGGKEGREEGGKRELRQGRDGFK